MTEAANKIGNGMTAAELKTFAKAKQVQINLGNGDFTVADNVWFKDVIRIENGIEVKEIHVIINETKLSNGTNLTTRQNQFKNALTGGTTSYGVRSTQFLELKGKNIVVKSFIRTNGNGSISDVFNCEKLF